MTRRHIHYEAAFEDYLRSLGQPYIAVDEHKKAIFGGGRVKSFDFLVYRRHRCTWMVDVKGRKFPYVSEGQRRTWENWIPRADLEGLQQWETAFGSGFQAMLVFAYHLLDDDRPVAMDSVHLFRDARYAFWSVTLPDYRDACRPRSARWDTVFVPTRRFRAIARPVAETLFEQQRLPAVQPAYNEPTGEPKTSVAMDLPESARR